MNTETASQCCYCRRRITGDQFVIASEARVLRLHPSCESKLSRDLDEWVFRGQKKSVALTKDSFGRPVPWSKEQRTAARPRLEWPEYAAEKSPIFIGGAVHELYQGMRDAGMSVSDIRTVLDNIARRPDLLVSPGLTAAGEFLGLGIYRDHEDESSTHGRRRSTVGF